MTEESIYYKIDGVMIWRLHREPCFRKEETKKWAFALQDGVEGLDRGSQFIAVNGVFLWCSAKYCNACGPTKYARPCNSKWFRLH